MTKIHFIGSQLRGGWQVTACGIWGMKCKGFQTEYDTDVGNRIEAHYNDWKGVTCGRCLKNPHAPGNRCSVLPSEER